jgi:hypothetical protein
LGCEFDVRTLLNRDWAEAKQIMDSIVQDRQRQRDQFGQKTQVLIEMRDAL